MAQERETAEELEVTPKFRNFDWEKAKTFYYVAKSGSFVNAARLLNISQSALSRQVIYLEQQLECPLFSRHRDGIKLTRKGEELFDIVESTFIKFRSFTRNIHAETANGGRRKLRIATTHAITSYILDNLIFDYNEQRPELVFELISDDHLIDIVLNDVDIAIRPYDSIAKGVEQEPLFSLEKKLYASPTYLEKYGEPQKVEDLKDHCIIAHAHPEEHPYSDINWILRLGMPEGQLNKPVFTSTSVESLVKAAKKGKGVIGSYEEMEIIKNSNLKNILPEVKAPLVKCYFVYPKHLAKDGEVQCLKTYLLEKLQILQNQNYTLE